MLRYGEAPYLEASSKGDKRYSAFYARIHARGGRSIEDIYQAAKKFEDPKTGAIVSGLTWREAKGRRAVNADEVRRLYAVLSDEYIYEHRELIEILTAASGISDIVDFH